MLMGRVTTAAAAIISISISAHAWAETDCASIANDWARNTCYGLSAKDTTNRVKPAAPQLTTAAMDLRSRLDKLFLEAGIDIQVIVISKPPAAGKLPQLMLFGYVSRVSIYQITTKTDLIRRAKEAGFRSIDFFSKSGDGHWVFDLTGSGQTCARGGELCF